MKATDARRSQIEKFREATRELETVHSEEVFERVLRKVTKAPAPEDEKKSGD